MTVQLKPPSPFPFHRPDEWQRWKRRFEQFREASGLSSESQQRQVCMLLYTMGEEAEDTLMSTKITEDDKKDYAKVIAKFDSFFRVRKNVIFERAMFNRRCQKQDESVEQFITCLYQLSENCAYGELRDEMIRDRIVVGIRDEAMSQKLQLDADLTLESAKKLVRQREAVREQQIQLKNGSQEEQGLPVEAMGSYHGAGVRSKKFNKSARPANKTTESARPQPTTRKKCTRCGRGPHFKQHCPAREAICHRCRKKGHYKSQCFSNVAEATEDSSTELGDTSFLDAVSDERSSTSWNESLLVNGQSVIFKVDTGAEVSVITEETMNRLTRLEQRSTTKRLITANKTPLDVKCEFTACLTYSNRSVEQTLYVVKGIQNNLLGLPAIKALKMLAKVETIQKTILEQYPSLFTGLGTLSGEYKIELKPDAKPFALYTPRNVPFPLREKVQKELGRMESLGVISKVEKPSSWCAGMVVVPKKSGAIRICVDYRPLNENVLREVHPLPTVEENLSKLTGATVFSKLDSNCGFWQIPLEESSRELTTFITPFGRYRFNKLPFGICSAPEHFQRRMSEILAGLEGVIVHIDDVLVYGKTQEEHDERLHGVLKRIASAGGTLNKDKCEFSKDTLTFLGHIVGRQGVSSDPEKTRAIVNMEEPKNLKELRRFMGMANQLGKFSPNLAECSQPLRELLSPRKSWVWGPAQQEAFQNMKEELTKPTVLALYNPNAKTKIRADASAYGLGAVLLQYHEGEDWKPIAYASKSMTETEKRYSQIEKEALALVWACEKFADYVIGKHIELETDHKPLIPLLGKTQLDSLPPRVLRFRLRLTRFDYSIAHVPGMYLYTADTLSRAPIKSVECVYEDDKDVERFVETLVEQLPASKERLEQFRRAQKNDPICSTVIQYTRSGWPASHAIKGVLKKYWGEKEKLSVADDLLLYGTRVVIPESLQYEILMKIHHGHQGIQRCRLRVSSSVWWPGISKQVEDFVRRCPTCMKNTPPPVEPMLQSSLPTHPWEKVGADLFQLKDSTYLIVVDYYSRYMEIQKLTSITSAGVISALKAMFSRHGIPVEFMSDNGPQFASQEMKDFAERYCFSLTTSSPHYPQSNGLAERTVKTVKKLITETDDPYLALLSYRATPLPWCGLSPAELLMGRRIRTDVPQIKKYLTPDWPHLKDFPEKDKQYKLQQKKYYDQRHRTSTAVELPEGTPVWVSTQDSQSPGTVSQQLQSPRSYIVGTPTGQVRRNRRHLRVRSENATSESPEEAESPSNNGDSTESRDTRVIRTRSQTGTVVRPPDRFSN